MMTRDSCQAATAWCKRWLVRCALREGSERFDKLNDEKPAIDSDRVMPDAMPTLNSEDAEHSLIKIVACSRQVILLRVRQKNGSLARDDLKKGLENGGTLKRNANIASNGVVMSQVRPV